MKKFKLLLFLLFFINNLLSTVCEICLTDKHAQSFYTLNCGDKYCKTCIKQMFKISLQEKNTRSLVCPNVDCKKHFQFSDIIAITNDDPILINEYSNILIKEQKGFKYCPTPTCKYGFLNDKKIKKTFKCPECSQSYCANCLILHDQKISCENVKDNEIYNNHRNLMLKKNIKRCPSCGNYIEKNGGCDHMKCKSCNYDFCWNCLKISHRLNPDSKCTNKSRFITKARIVKPNIYIQEINNQIQSNDSFDAECAKMSVCCCCTCFLCCILAVHFFIQHQNCLHSAQSNELYQWTPNLDLLQSYNFNELYSNNFINRGECALYLKRLLNIKKLNELFNQPAPERETMEDDDKKNCNLLTQLKEHESQYLKKITAILEKSLWTNNDSQLKVVNDAYSDNLQTIQSLWNLHCLQNAKED